MMIRLTTDNTDRTDSARCANFNFPSVSSVKSVVDLHGQQGGIE